MLQLRKSVSGGIKDSQKMKTSFFDCFYVMPPLKNGGHYRIPPSNWLLIAGALLSKQRSYDGIEIKIITAEGVKSTPIKLSLISEDNLYLARRFSSILRNIYKLSEIKYPQDDNFIKSFPKSKGNDIFIDDIIVDS